MNTQKKLKEVDIDTFKDLKAKQDFKENFYSLLLSIKRNYSVDTSLEKMGIPLKKRHSIPKFSSEELDNILKMREDKIKLITIADMYNTTVDVINKRIAKYKKQKGDLK